MKCLRRWSERMLLVLQKGFSLKTCSNYLRYPFNKRFASTFGLFMRRICYSRSNCFLKNVWLHTWITNWFKAFDSHKKVSNFYLLLRFFLIYFVFRSFGAGRHSWQTKMKVGDKSGLGAHWRWINSNLKANLLLHVLNVRCMFEGGKGFVIIVHQLTNEWLWRLQERNQMVPSRW